MSQRASPSMEILTMLNGFSNLFYFEKAKKIHFVQIYENFNVNFFLDFCLRTRAHDKNKSKNNAKRLPV